MTREIFVSQVQWFKLELDLKLVGRKLKRNVFKTGGKTGVKKK